MTDSALLELVFIAVIVTLYGQNVDLFEMNLILYHICYGTRPPVCGHAVRNRDFDVMKQTSRLINLFLLGLETTQFSVILVVSLS